jgi:hypothetical protein
VIEPSSTSKRIIDPRVSRENAANRDDRAVEFPPLRPLDDDLVSADDGTEALRRREKVIDSCLGGCRRVDELDELGQCFACAGGLRR